MTYFGHIMRKKCPEKEIVHGTTPGCLTSSFLVAQWVDQNWVRQHQTMDGADNGETVEYGWRQTTVEDCCTWCVQPSNLGWQGTKHYAIIYGTFLLSRCVLLQQNQIGNTFFTVPAPYVSRYIIFPTLGLSLFISVADHLRIFARK